MCYDETTVKHTYMSIHTDARKSEVKPTAAPVSLQSPGDGGF